LTQPACASAAASSEPHFAPRFAELISPFPVDRFFSDYWETKSLIVEGEVPERLQHLITIDETDRILTTLHLHAPEIRLARGEQKLQLEDFTRPSGAIDALAVSQSFAGGTTIIFDQMQRRVPALGALCPRRRAFTDDRPWRTHLRERGRPAPRPGPLRSWRKAIRSPCTIPIARSLCRQRQGISLDFLLSGRKVAVAEIPGPLDIAGKTTLVRRLIREGLIEVMPT
jgi:hypothetical protein